MFARSCGTSTVHTRECQQQPSVQLLRSCLPMGCLRASRHANTGGYLSLINHMPDTVLWQARLHGHAASCLCNHAMLCAQSFQKRAVRPTHPCRWTAGWASMLVSSWREEAALLARSGRSDALRPCLNAMSSLTTACECISRLVRMTTYRRQASIQPGSGRSLALAMNASSTCQSLYGCLSCLEADGRAGIWQSDTWPRSG